MGLGDAECIVSKLFQSRESDSSWRTIDIQHAPKLASANESDLDRFAAGFAFGEFGRETRHDRWCVKSFFFSSSFSSMLNQQLLSRNNSKSI